MKPRVAIVRGAFLNQYEMQSFAPLAGKYNITAYASLRPFHSDLPFPVVKLPSPMDLPEFPYKMPILNRVFVDVHYLFGLESRLTGSHPVKKLGRSAMMTRSHPVSLVHAAETYYRYTQQALNAKRHMRKHGVVVKVIATVLENIPHNNEGIWGRKQFKARARKELDHIIALTQGAKAALVEEGCDPAKITVIGFGVDISRFRPVRRKNEKLTILFCGRIEEEKGVFDLLEAVHGLGDKMQIGKLLFVGDGLKKQELQRRVDEWGMQRIVQFESLSYDRMPQAYARADIFVAPSRARKDRSGKVTWLEQYGMVLLEAQAAGLPIITTWSGGIPENVGDAAILVEPADPSGIAQALKRLVRDEKLREDLGRRARRRAVSVHDARLIARRIASVWDRVMVE
jgi:glycosyltransferase involved in cell wall biosynthesis